MRRVVVCVIALLLAPAVSESAWAYGHANRWGGSTSHTFGATSHTSAFGTSTTHVAGVGTEHTNAYGGRTAHGYYGGTAHTTPYGATAYRPPDRYYGYHPPTTVGYYGAHCYNCGGGGWAAAAGVAAGAAIGASAAAANTAVATAGAFNAGVAAGASMAARAYAVGQVVAALPAGCVTPEVQGRSYYLCANTWFAAAYGANGVYYKVVPTP